MQLTLLFGSPLVFLESGFWAAINLVIKALIPFLVLALTAVGRLLYQLLNRVGDLEEQVNQQMRTLYGDPQDAMHDGLSSEVREMKTSIENVEKMLTEIESHLNEDDEDEEEE